MFLKKIELYGFKSFADRTLIQVNQGITAIIGPNGCGKSNIADAIRWVLGEQRVSSLRGNQMQDVIFSGTATRKPLNFAEVTLTIDNTTHILPIEYSEVSVTRRIYRSGESEYQINKTKCRMRDISELFMDTGVGREGYSIISQGKIAEIISSKPEERRHIFEDAAGISKYRNRKVETERKLTRTKDHLLRLTDIEEELKNRLEPLEKQREKALKYLEIKETLRTVEINSFLYNYDNNINKIDNIKKKIETSNSDLDKENQISKENDEKLISRKEELNQARNNLENIQELIKSSEVELQKIRGEKQLFQNNILSIERENQNLSSDKERDTEYINQDDTRLIEFNQNLSQKQVEFDENNEKLNELNTQVKEKEEIYDRTRSLLRENYKEKENINAEINNNQNKITALTTSIKNLDKTSAETEILDENQIKIKEYLFSSINELEKQISGIKNNIEDINNKGAEQNEKIIALENKIESEKQTIEHLSKEINIKTARVRVLAELKANYEGYHQPVARLLKSAQNTSEIDRKICGVLGELVNCEKEYSTAIEIALGNALHNVVCENQQDGKFLINYLKTNRLGRVTFLPIESIKPRFLNAGEKSAVNQRGCIGIASDLVEYDSKYDGIVKNLLGRVLIVDNLDSAIAISKRHNIKVVTLGGDVINPGGSMTGGSISQKRSGLVSRDKEIEDIKNYITKNQPLLEKKREDITTIIKDLGQAKSNQIENQKEKNNLDISLAKAESEYNNAKNSLEKSENELISSQERAERRKDEKLKLENELSETQKVIEEYQTKLVAIEAGIEQNEELKEEEGIKLNSITNIRQGLEVKVAELKQDINGITKNLNEYKAVQNRYKTSIVQKDDIIAKNIVRLEELKKSIDEIDKRIIEKGDNITDINTKKEDLQKEITKKAQSLELIEEKTKQIQATVLAIENLKYKQELNLEKLEEDVEKNVKNIWDSYQLTYAQAKAYKDDSLDQDSLNKDLVSLKRKIQALGNVNVNAIDEFVEVNDRYQHIISEHNDLDGAIEDMETIIVDVSKTMKEIFLKEFKIIDENFCNVFKKLFMGGQGKLVLEDPDNPLECGIDIVVQPPGKRLQSMSLFSGGEKALTAISILFAILTRRPALFCVLDEIEAALDEHNISGFAEFLNQFADGVQFLLITHRKGTMEAANSMYGVAMEEKGVSRLLSVNLEDIENTN